MAPPRKSRKGNQGRGMSAGEESPDISQLLAEKIAAIIPTIAFLVAMRLNLGPWNPAIKGAPANPLTDNLTRSEELVNPGQKRKAETSTGWETGGNNDKKHKGVENFGAVRQVVGSGTGKGYVGTYPKCTRCNYHHYGECPVCHNCNRLGHYAKYCWKGKRGCFECGSNDHQYKDCPKLKGGRGTSRKACYECGSPEHMRNKCPRVKAGGPARGRAFVIRAEEARKDDNVVTSTLLLNNHYASVLFDAGADKSLVSKEFRELLETKSTKLSEAYVTEFANEQEISANEVILGCQINLEGQVV